MITELNLLRALSFPAVRHAVASLQAYIVDKTTSHTTISHCKVSDKAIKMSARPKVLVTRPACQEGMDMLKSVCDIQLWQQDDAPIPRDDFLRLAYGVDAIWCHPPDKIDSELLEAAGPRLKVVGTMSVGLDHIDKEACRTRNVQVGYTPDVLTDAVAEMTIGLLLATARRFKEGFLAVTDGGWGTWDNAQYLCGKQVAASTVGIVGLGKIGFAVAKRLKSFNVAKILYSGNSEKSWASEVGAEFVSFDKLLTESDFVIACCSINEGNKGLFNKDAFSKMKKSAIFINTTRGVLVNQDDLYEALKSAQIAAAGLDVTTPEPINYDSPLLRLKNCTITPHIGSATYVARNLMSNLTARNIMAGVKGESLPSPVPNN